MDERDPLVACFEEHRSHLRAVALRMLGSGDEADDAVQETWLRFSRSGTDGVANPGGWLTTIVSRVCLNMLRSRTSRRELPLGEPHPDPVADRSGDPEHRALQADAVGAALIVVLDTLTPAERLAFVLHDLFAVPFEEIARIVDRSPAAARQLASRARRRVQGSLEAGGGVPERRREVVGAFLAAAHGGDFDALLTLLDPDVVLRADPAAVRMGAPSELRGAPAVAGTFTGRALAAHPALIDGAAGAVWAPGGRPRVAFGFTVAAGRITAITMTADPGLLGRVDLDADRG
ncbi:RNA polymerase sigma-70 factor (ECF subfamily) [Murinocardiopsis flavida]|uniref:RNA polymerase sigma-70 factor (ECF subfamily) n=1 Tax=Murinocardiopsis flavida TaxID=645275 RepID=A0A2P8DTN6_9ACTN|nr:sigma-70 family RNA polymerase sigma factor [Murinocardiopsis flavida]PSL00578.1 RNA polymerase sigma-70 factor (ECF subfamily) [Murinocardiopsis flavida]